MKYIYILKLTLAASPMLMLVGCCPSGCFVLHGETFKELAYPKPMRDYWTHPNKTNQQRSEDWITCGGHENGWHYSSAAEIEAARKPGEDLTNPIRARLTQRVLDCMSAKGYQRGLR